MSEQPESKDKKTVVEWSFSFDQLSESINRFFSALGGDQEIKTETFSEPLDGAVAAHIALGRSLGTITVSALQSAETLFEAEVHYLGELEYRVVGDAEKDIYLAQKWNWKEGAIPDQMRSVISQFANRDALRWTVGVSPAVPVKLALESGVGVSRLDLTGLKLTELELEGGVGETFLVLPATGSRYGAKIESGVGSTHVTIQDGAALNLKINAGVGGVTIQIPPDSAVRLEVESGLGGVHVPAHLRRVKGGGDLIGSSGVWETEGFALHAQQIYIHFKGGVGGLKLE